MYQALYSLDHGVGHPLLLLCEAKIPMCEAKIPKCRKNKAFKDLGHYAAWPKVADAVVKARSSFSYWPKGRATALYESGAARKRHALRGSVRDGHARDCWVFGPCAPFLLTSYVSVFSHDFKRFERLTKLATSS